MSVQVSLNENQVRKTILNMDEKKASLTDDIPTRILNGCVDSYNCILTKTVNTSLEKNCFPNQLAVHKKRSFSIRFPQ